MNRKQNHYATLSIHSAYILDAVCSSCPLISKIQKEKSTLEGVKKGNSFHTNNNYVSSI